MHSAPLSAAGRGEGGEGTEPPTKISKRRSLTEPQALQESCWVKRGDFFQGRGG